MTALDTAKTHITSSLEAKELIIERIFNAPRELVFQMWSDPKHLAQWWGPKEWPLTYCTVDFRPGGVWHYCMTGPDGTQAWGKATYREITPPERIVYVDAFADADGNINPDLPELISELIFEDLDGKTKLINRSLYKTAQDLQTVLDMGMVEGITETFDRLDALLDQLQKGE